MSWQSFGGQTVLIDIEHGVDCAGLGVTSAAVDPIRDLLGDLSGLCWPQSPTGTVRRSATKTEPAFSGMLAKLRRTIIAARFLLIAAAQPTTDEVRAVQQAWATASLDVAA